MIKDTKNITEAYRGNTAAEIYQIQPSYQRFNQKNNITRLQHWDPKVIEIAKERRANLTKLIETNRNGYKLEDWAFYVGSWANMVNSGFSINWPNQKGNSWSPLIKGQNSHGLLPEPYTSFGKLEVDTERASQLVSKVARQFGADDAGFCLLDRKWVYSHWFDEETKKEYPIKFSDESGYESYTVPIQLEDRTQVIPKELKYVSVLIHEMDERGIATAPTLIQMGTVHHTYSRISFTAVMLAEFIRALGYNAIPCANDTALSIPLAIDAGFGELGRNAKLIHPKFGPRCRISKVITDLPLTISQPKLWGVTEFCNICGKCARNCPASAIPTGKPSFEPLGIYNHRGVFQWQVDHLKCYEYMASVGTGCGICIRTCPFNKSKHWIHNLPRWFIRRKNGEFDSLMKRIDDVLGYGKFRDADYFWDN